MLDTVDKLYFGGMLLLIVLVLCMIGKSVDRLIKIVEREESNK